MKAQHEDDDGPCCFTFAEARMLERAGKAPRGFLGESSSSSDTITRFDRADTVDVMTAAAAALNLGSGALNLGVCLLDRCLGALQHQLPLLGFLATACLWVAAKYEESSVPHAHRLLAAMQQGTCCASHELLVKFERHVLQALDFRVYTYPTTHAFLSIMLGSWGPGISQATSFCAHYLAEMSLLEYILLDFPASEVAAAAFVCACILTSAPFSTAQLARVTGYTLSQLAGCSKVLFAQHLVLYKTRDLPASQRHAVFNNFAAPSSAQVALLVSGIESTRDVRLRDLVVVDDVDAASVPAAALAAVVLC